MTPTTGQRVGQNVADLRRQRGLTTRALEGRLAALGWKILHPTITRIEKGERAVNVDDLVALALALGVNPNRLLMPPRADGQEVELTSTIRPLASQAWAWADGEQPLLMAPVYDQGTAWNEAMSDFQHHARPADKRLAHHAARAAQDVIARIDNLLSYLVQTGQGSMGVRDINTGETFPVDVVPSGHRSRGEVLTRLDGDPVAALQRAKDRLNAEVEDLLRVAQRTHRWPPEMPDISKPFGDEKGDTNGQR